jgi:hypothetical protein
LSRLSPVPTHFGRKKLSETSKPWGNLILGCSFRT